ncbi:MAG: YlxR family protein [Chloroflexi bacterium]|nr:YlxR family protein [Chloroflexota bacterium]
MAPKKRRRGKHIPQRTCIGCRTVSSKWELIRIVRTPDGVQIDPTRRLPGRGAYLHANRACWEAAFKRRAFARALRTTLTQADIQRLRAFMETLPAEELPREEPESEANGG